MEQTKYKNITHQKPCFLTFCRKVTLFLNFNQKYWLINQHIVM